MAVFVIPERNGNEGKTVDLGYFAINDKKKAVLLNEEALKFTRNDTEDVR